MILKYTKRLLTAMVIIGATVSTSFASLSIITPGNFASPIGTETIAGGATLLDTVTSPFSVLNLSGTLISKVYSGDANNTLGGLSFEYTLSIDSGSTHGINRMSIDNWDYDTSVGVANSTGVTSGSANFGLDSTIGFNWFGSLVAGQSSVVVVDSALKHYWDATARLQDGTQISVASLAAVPEASTVVAAMLLLFPLGLSTLRIVRRNRMA